MPRNVVAGMLREGLYTRVVGRRVLYFRRVSSTMDEAARLALEGAEDGTVVLAEEQTAARGRFDRVWVTQEGNLYLSIVLRPSRQALQYLSIVSGVAMARAIRKTIGLRPTIKWPNDVRLGGKKVCGVLVESSLLGDSVRYAIVGIGINVALDLSVVDGLADIATSLHLEAGTEVGREALLRNLLQEVDKLYLPLRGINGGPHASAPARSLGDGSLEQVMAEWRGLLETLGREVQVRWGEDVYAGYAEDVDDLGNLMLRQADGTLVTLPAGEVTAGTVAGGGE